MKKGWEIKRLGDICTTGAGGTPSTAKKEYYQNGTVPWLMSGEVRQGAISSAKTYITEKALKNSSAKVFPKDTVLIALYGATAGQVGILKIDAATNQAVCGILPNSHFVPEFLFYLLLSKYDEIVSQAVGNAQPNLSQIKIRNTEVLIIPIPEQKRIVGILDKAFAAISTAKANAEKNLQNARELFESYLQGVFANPGDGWEEKKLGEIGETQTGTTPKTSDKENYGNFIPFVTPADIDISGDGTIRYREEGLSEQGLKNGRKMIISSILMVCIGASIGKVGFVDRDISCNQQINSLTVKSGFCPKFFYYALSTKGFFEQVIKNSAQATLPIINKGKWEKLTISYPASEKEQRSIVAKLDALSAETQKLAAIYQQKLTDLDELKKSVLQKAFNGGL